MNTVPTESVDNPQTPAVRWAVLVVHGVGETDPGQTLNRFLPEFLRQRGLPENTVEERKALTDEDGSEFPLALRRVDLTRATPAPRVDGGSGAGAAAADAASPRLRPREAIFGEVFWADLSRAGSSPWSLLLRVFTIIFRIYYLAHQAARMPGALSWLLRLCLYAISGVLCGPIAGLNLFMLFLLVAHFGLRWLDYPDAETLSISGLGLAALGVALVFLIPATRKKGSYPWSLALACLALIGVGVAMLGILEHRELIASPIAAATGLTLRAPGADHGQISVFLSYFEFMLLLNRWCFLGVGALAGLAVVVWLLAAATCAVRSDRRRYIAGLSAGLAATLLQLGMWVILVPAIALAGLLTFMPRQLEEEPLNQLWSFFLFNLAAGLIVLAAGLVAWGWRVAKLHFLMPSRHPARRGDDARRTPRILAHWLILAALITATLLGIGSFVYSFLSGRPAPYHDALMRQRSWIGPVLLVAAGLAAGGFFYRPARNALHILMDIISHFHRSRVRFPLYLGGREKGKPLAGEDALADYFIQQRIQSRFENVLRALLEDGTVTHVTIVAHSQGTVVAVDALWFWEVFDLLKGQTPDRRVYLVTMGSPLTHLYQHYFPWRYGPLFPVEQPSRDYLQPWGNGLRRSLDEWINLFRINDFIGTFIDGAPDFPENLCFPMVHAGGGHADYWNDPAIVAEMLRFLPDAIQEPS